jgi:hypothetical protein
MIIFISLTILVVVLVASHGILVLADWCITKNKK